jgi:hypothetical protein
VRSNKRVDGSQDGWAEFPERINGNAGWKEAGEDQLKGASASVAGSEKDQTRIRRTVIEMSSSKAA